IVYELVKRFNFTSHQVPDIVKLLDAQQGRYVQSSTHRIIRNRNWLIIAAVETQQTDIIIIEKEDKDIAFTAGRLLIEEVPEANMVADANVAMLSSREIRFPLILRKWRQGDYFYPLGMRKKKKLARFLIDARLSP